MVALLLAMVMLFAVACGTTPAPTDTASPTLSAEPMEVDPMAANANGEDITLPDDTDEPDADKQAQFASFTGTIKEVTEYTDADGKPVEGKFYVLVENDEGGEMNFIVSEDTVRVQDGKLIAGEKLTGWYDATRPAIMIYPPQQPAVAIVLGELTDGKSVHVDRFDNDLLSYDSQLKLNMSDDVEIVLANGDAFDGDLADRKLIVIYGPVTMSIPAQTTPIKIIVLYEDITAEPLPIDHAMFLGENPEYVVDGEKIDAPAPHINDDNVLMVPLKDIAEALGYEVTYDEEAKTMRLGNATTVTVGENSYIVGRMAPIELNAAPELVDGELYVPLNYFTTVLGMNNAYVLEGQIVIDDNEKME